MQKKLIALAIAGLSSAAFAQSNVVIYGVMDASYDNVSATGATTTPSTNNQSSRSRVQFDSSYIGFKGHEDLGGGNKAVWQIETGIYSQTTGQTTTNLGGTTANTQWATRDTFLGVAGNWGTVVAGNLTGPTRLVGAKMDVNPGATTIGANTALLGKVGAAYDGSGASVFDQRISGAIAYISPTWSGFHFGFGYRPNEGKAIGDTPAHDISGYDLGLIYDQGPLFVALTQMQAKDKATDTTKGILAYGTATDPNGTFRKATDTRVAVKYNFGMATVGLLYDRVTSTVAGATETQANRTAYYIPVTVKAGANGTVLFQYGKAQNGSGSLRNSWDNTGARHYELGYQYDLSKRTSIRALYTAISNDTNAKYDFLFGSGANGGTTTAISSATTNSAQAGADPRGFSIGLRHNF